MAYYMHEVGTCLECLQRKGPWIYDFAKIFPPRCVNSHAILLNFDEQPNRPVFTFSIHVFKYDAIQSYIHFVAMIDKAAVKMLAVERCRGVFAELGQSCRI